MINRTLECGYTYQLPEHVPGLIKITYRCQSEDIEAYHYFYRALVTEKPKKTYKWYTLVTKTNSEAVGICAQLVEKERG